MKTGRVQRIVFWEPSASPHKLVFIEQIALQNPSLDIIVVADSPIAGKRKDMGWEVPLIEGVKVLVSPNLNEIDEVVSELPGHSLHVFAGIRHFQTLVVALRKVRRLNCRVYILSEPRVREGLRGAVRYLQSLFLESALRKDVEVVLAIGSNGPRWFSAVGYSKSRIFPFAYFVPPSNVPVRLPSDSHPDRFRVGYVGRLIREKGVFDLLAAFEMLGENAQLTVIGSGVEEDAMRRCVTRRSLNCDFLGPVPIGTVSAYIASFDVLVLASTTEDDGWGVVVSEALLVGTPVVVSSKAGSSLSVISSEIGEVVPPCSPKALAEAIERIRLSGRSLNRRLKVRAWAESTLSASAGAKYFIDIVRWAEGECVERPIDFQFSNKQCLETADD